MLKLGFWSGDTNFGEAFQEEDVRRKFIAKVLMILLAQLLFTAGTAAFFVLNEGAMDWMSGQTVLAIVMGIVFMVIQFILICCNTVARAVPWNYILLFVATVAQSFVLSFVCSKYAPKQIMTALIVTIILVTILCLLALCAPCDFTHCMLFLVVIGVVFMLIGLATIFIKSKILTWIYVTLGILVFSLALVVNIQQLVRADCAHKYTEDDYILAALSLYVDIVMLLQMILKLVGLIEGDED